MINDDNFCVCCNVNPCVCSMKPSDFDDKNTIGEIEKEANKKLKKNIINWINENEEDIRDSEDELYAYMIDTKEFINKLNSGDFDDNT